MRLFFLGRVQSPSYLLLFLLLTLHSVGRAQDALGKWINPNGIHGALIISGTGEMPVEVTQTLARLGDAEPVTIEAASAENSALRFDLLPDAMIDLHFTDRDDARLQSELRLHPARFGLALETDTAVVVRGRTMQVFGKNRAVVFLAAGAGRGATRVEYRVGQQLDITAWRRAARDRVREPFPRSVLKPVQVDQGSLVIVGGGDLADEVLSRFIELAGGVDAPIVVLPTAMSDAELSESMLDREGIVRRLRAAGAAQVSALGAKSRSAVESQEFIAKLGAARGVWFGGGRQWRFVDAYEHTRAMTAFHAVLARGGVIGGSSAGASIQAEYLVRGNPLGNTDMMALGYERGFGFLPGTAIDQHFSQRHRFQDLASVVMKYPQLVGIGIDESTALIVQGSRGEVIGPGNVYVYDHQNMATSELPYISISQREHYDFVSRELVQLQPTAELKAN